MANSYSPRSMATFTAHFRSITAGLGTNRGWFPALLARDPQGMRAFVSGDEIPPWDVVASLLQDFREFGGVHPGGEEETRRLHQEAVKESDLRTGRHALVKRLESGQAERDEAQKRLIILKNRSRDHADPEAVVWEARDLYHRAATRHAELQRRLVELDSALPPKRTPAAAPKPDATAPTPSQEAARKRAVRLGLLGSLASGPPGVQLQHLLLADDEVNRPAVEEEPEDPAEAAIEWEEVHQISWQLAKLRAENNDGQAYVLLCETAAGLPTRLPRLARALEQTDQAHEVALLLWEAASLPPALHAAVTIAFSDEDRTDDVRMLLRHAAGRRPGDIAALALALEAARHPSEAAFLLRTVLQGRPRDFAVDLARAEPSLIPLLLKEAQAVAGGPQTQLEYLLRIEGLTSATRKP